jgi:NAD(P)-dependent dehydrogenase (short-subunit alcohol dehydrogenase family)
MVGSDRVRAVSLIEIHALTCVTCDCFICSIIIVLAAILSSKSIVEMSEEEFSRCLNVNLFAAYWVRHTCQRSFDHMTNVSFFSHGRR